MTGFSAGQSPILALQVSNAGPAGKPYADDGNDGVLGAGEAADRIEAGRSGATIRSRAA